MLSFIFHHIFSLKARSFGIFFVTLLVSVFLFLSLLLYKNTLSALSYYTQTTLDPTRVVFTTDTNIFDLFSKNGGGIEETQLESILSDPLFGRTRVLRFVDTNIVGTFDIFTFRLETDIPVFTLEDSEGDMSGFGISPSMLHYYNLELAGSHPLFPPLDIDSLEGKSVALTFGASKIFSTNGIASKPLKKSISTIDSDFPGFGIVVPKNAVDTILEDISVSPRTPYKIIAYMEYPGDKEKVRTKYSGLEISFDQDREKVIERRMIIMKSSLLAIAGIILFIVLSFLFVLLLGYFRERGGIRVLSTLYALPASSSLMLLYGEMLIFLFLSSLFLWLGIVLFESEIVPSIALIFREYGVIFPLLTTSPLEKGGLILIVVVIFLLMMTFASRKK